MKGKILKKVLAAALVLTLVTGGMPISPVSDMFGGVGIVASAATYTDFLDCSSGTATGYFTYNNHFYKVYWSGINTSQTTSVLLRDSSGAFQAFRNGSNNSSIGLYLDGTASYSWKTSDIENLSPEQSSSGYTTYGNLATGASSNPRVFKKVCTVTCMAANAPTWNWSADYSTCTATFTCAENSSLTATVNANVTASGNTATASVTFNGQSYSDTKNTTCTVTWKNDDGTVLKTDTVAYNSTPSYGGTPTKAGNAQYSYTFSGWSPAVSAVTSDTTYTAQYTQTTNSYTVTWKNADGTVLETDTNVSYGATPTYNGATPTKASDDKYSYTFKEWSPSVSAVSGNVTYTAQFTKAPIAAHFSQSGDTYTIHDEKGWDIFCDLIDSGETFSGKTIILENDIGTKDDPITVTAGKCDPNDSANDRVFKGVFDGNHKTLTFSTTAADNYVAPFANMNGTESAHAAISDLNVKTTITGEDYRHLAGLVAVHTGYVDITNCNADVSISCLKGDNNPSDLYPTGLVSQSSGTLTVSGCTVTGSIATDGKYASGLIGIVQGKASVENCKSSVTINSSTSGDGTHGGLVGVTASNSTTTIEGCVFGGKLLTVGENDTGNCGGILGWKNANVTISNTIYAPAELTGNEKEVQAGTGNYPSGTFYRGNEPTMTNCYYTRTLDTAQGKAAHTITGAKDVTLGIYGTATQENPDGCTVYSVSGITAYEGSSGLKYGNKYYAGKEETVNLTLGYEFPETTGYKWDGAYNVSAGTLEGSDNPYTLTMPESNVTVSPVIEKDLITVNYIDEDGKEATVEAYLLDGTETTLNGTYDKGWYIVYNDVTFDHTITLEKDTGQVNLILADDRTMTVNIADENSDADGIDINDSLLNIFRQKGGTGTLNVTTAGTGGAINLNDGLLYIYGGIINVTCSDKGKFAIGDTIGTLMRRSINFTGGKVTANGAIINRNEETGKNFEIYCDFSGADDFVYATEYVGNVQVKLGQTITDGTALYEGTLSNDQLTAIAGKKLKFVYPVAINDVRGGTVSADKLFVYPDDQDKTVTLTPSPALGYQLKSYTVKDADNQEITVTDNKFTMSDSPVTVTAEFEKVQSSIEYLDENGTKKTASAYVLDGLEKEISSGWYYISGKTTFPGSTYVSGRITVSGDVHLILCDGCEMNATDGINVSGDNSLTIYAQSVDKEKGILNVIVTDNFLENAGIGSNANNDGGNITINGGVINAAAKEGACIGGGQNGSAGNITINGGVINATERENSIGGAGIGCGAYGSGGAITINGGTVTAVGAEDSAGIGGASDGKSEPAVTITINGGDISATGGQNGAGIGSGNRGKCGKITITGGNISATGSLEAAGIGCGKSGDSGDIEISGGTVIAEGGAYGLFSGGSGIGGGEVNAPFTGNIMISGGDVTATGKGNYPGIGAPVSDEELYMTGKIKISGGKVTANADLYDDNSAASGICCSDIEISKGTVIAYSTGDWPAIGSKYGKGKITISGGDVTAEAQGNNAAGIGGGTITISGGIVEATGSKMAAGIGGGSFVDGGTITISDGKVTASAGEFGAGIGGGYNGNGGNITISGGTVKATGGSEGAGIGSGYNGEGGTITINGGTIIATGGDSGAGIGGGKESKGRDITINGGKVTATGGGGAAGIGGGYNGNGGNITISGGTIIATGGTSDYDCGGAGIGSGYNGEGGTITIEDGDITATGGAKAAGIGGGYYKSCGTIKINGGTVKATGGSEGAGIGSGYYGEGGDITINGGKITAEGGIGNASDYTGEYKCTVNLGYTDKADYITASAYNGEVTVTKDKLFTDSTNLYSGTLTDEQITALAGQTLVPAFMVTLPESVANGTINADKAFVAANADNKTVTLTVTPDTGYQVKSVKVNGTEIEAVNGIYSFTMPDGDVTVSAEFEEQKPITPSMVTLSETNLTYDGTEKTVTVTVKDGDKTLTEGKDYTLTGNIGTVPGRYFVHIEGKGSYTGGYFAEWRINGSCNIQYTINDKTETASAAYGTPYTVTAPQNNTTPFKCWMDGDKVVSYAPTYGFIVHKDMNLTAVYSSEAVENKYVLTMSASKTQYNGNNAIRFIFDRSIDYDAYTIKEVGIRYATNKLLGADTTIAGYSVSVNLTSEDGAKYLNGSVDEALKNGTNVKNYKSTASKWNGTVDYSYAVGTHTDAYVYAIGYVKVMTADNEEKTFYSNIVATSYEKAAQ